MSDIETAVKASRQIEDLLEKRYGASGRGLHEKLTSVERHLPGKILGQARYVASVRNAVVHDHKAIIKDRAGFNAASNAVVAFLNVPKPAGSKFVAPGNPTRSKTIGIVRTALVRLLAAILVIAGAILIGVALLALVAGNPPGAENTTGPKRPVELPQIR